MELHLFDKYKLATTLAPQRVHPCYEMSILFVNELNKTGGQPYVTKTGKKGKTKFYTEVMVMKDVKKLNISTDVHKMNGFFEECKKSNLGFRMYYNCKVK